MGEVLWLGRYPVKSMLGEELVVAALTDSGLAGDRRYALIDELTGLVASAKNPRKWRGLLRMTARHAADGRLEFVLADGRVIRDGDPILDAVLSRAVGRPVRLARTRADGAALERMTPSTEPTPGALTRSALAAGTPGDNFVDFAAVHVVTTATLDALGREHPRGAVDARRFRPDIVLWMLDPVPFVENTWPGRTLSLAGGAKLRVVAPTPRCVVPTLAQGNDLGDDADVLRTAARVNRTPVLDLGPMTCVGAYGAVGQGGRLRIGDRITIAA